MVHVPDKVSYGHCKRSQTLHMHMHMHGHHTSPIPCRVLHKRPMPRMCLQHAQGLMGSSSSCT